MINFPLTSFPFSMWSCGHGATRQNELLDRSPIGLSGSVPRQFVQHLPCICCVVGPLGCTRASPMMVPGHFILLPLRSYLNILSRLHLLSPERRGRGSVIRLRNARLLIFLGSNSAFYSPPVYIKCIRLVNCDHRTQLILPVYISCTN